MSELEANKNNAQIVMELLKNNTLIQYFASYSNVRTWNEKDLSNAITHATYCQKVAKEVTEKYEVLGLRNELNIRLAQMSAVFRTPFPFKLTIENLCYTMEHLLQALVYNHTLNSELDDRLLASIKASNLVPPSHPVLKSFKVIRKLLFEAHRAFTKLSSAFSSNESSESDRNNCAHYLLEQLRLLLEAAPPSVYLEIRVFELLSRWAWIPKGWQVLVESMCMDLGKVEQDKRTGMRQLFSLMVKWIKKQFGAHELKCGLMELSPGLLADLSSFNREFCEWYVLVLALIGDNYNKRLLQTEPELWYKLVHTPGNPLEDKESPEVTLLIKRLLQLFLKGDLVMTEAIHMIIDKYMDSENTIWIHIGISVYKLYGGM